jgi:hypothetical protein
MITASQIVEEVSGYVGLPGRSNKATIYENPTSSDFIELNKSVKSKSVRFIINNKTKAVYVWDANLALHTIVSRKLGLTIIDFLDKFPNIIWGVGKLSNGKVVMTESDIIDDILRFYIPTNSKDKEYLTKLKNTNWRWAYKYIDCNDYINKVMAYLR